LKNAKRWIVPAASSLAMLLLIVDTDTAVTGAKDGVSLCANVLIPSLFPFFLLSALLGNSLAGIRIPLLRPLNRLMGIPEGAESLFILGLTSGYPVGARSVCQAYENGQIRKADARRLLGFCSNAGPAFIFGMGSNLFQSSLVPWLLWIVHILSALLTGLLLPGKENVTSSMVRTEPIHLPQALDFSMGAMASVCGWVVIFKVVLAFLTKWVLFLLQAEVRALITGILELSNGFVATASISNEGLRFLFCCVMLSLGGLCVGMQTVSVTQSVGIGMYFPGKLLQCLLSIIIAIPIIWFVFSFSSHYLAVLWVTMVIILAAVMLILNLNAQNFKKAVAFVQ
jgi:hypothetical protein